MPPAPRLTEEFVPSETMQPACYSARDRPRVGAPTHDRAARRAAMHRTDDAPH
jgi:hypothetical protein